MDQEYDSLGLLNLQWLAVHGTKFSSSLGAMHRCLIVYLL
eukprot:SAG31_NODE_14213_length_820_cov_1.618585_1_plen_39_part_10